MKPLFGAAIGTGVAAAAWGIHAVRRNRRLARRRPPLTGRDGRLLRERWITYSDGETVDVVDEGSGPAIVMVPGADGMKETFRWQVPAFAEDHRVLAASLRRRFAADDGFDRLVEDVAELMDRRGVERAVLLGQSLGGPVCMRFAVRYPERARALVLVNTLIRVSYEHVGLNRTLLVPVAMLTTRYLPTALARALARLWSRLEVWIFDHSPGHERIIDYALWTGPRTVPPRVSAARVERLKRIELEADLPDIRAPVLVIKGPRDVYTPPAWAREIADRIPSAEYREVEETGHCSHISGAERFNRLVLEWVDDLGERRVDRRTGGPAARAGGAAAGMDGAPAVAGEDAE